MQKCPFIPDSFSKTRAATAGLPMTIASFVFEKIADTVSYLSLTKDQIIEKATIPELCFSGVYFIVKDEQIIYVGQSKNVYTRLGNHHVYKPGVGLKIAFLPVDTGEQSLDLIESYYIHKFTPSQTKGAPLASTNGKLQKAILKEIQFNVGIAIHDARKLFSDIGLEIKDEDAPAQCVTLDKM